MISQQLTALEAAIHSLLMLLFQLGYCVFLFLCCFVVACLILSPFIVAYFIYVSRMDAFEKQLKGTQK